MARFRPENTSSRVSQAALCGVVTSLLVAIGMLAFALQDMPFSADRVPPVLLPFEDIHLSALET